MTIDTATTNTRVCLLNEKRDHSHTNSVGWTDRANNSSSSSSSQVDNHKFNGVEAEHC